MVFKNSCENNGFHQKSLTALLLSFLNHRTRRHSQIKQARKHLERIQTASIFYIYLNHGKSWGILAVFHSRLVRILRKGWVVRWVDVCISWHGKALLFIVVPCIPTMLGDWRRLQRRRDISAQQPQIVEAQQTLKLWHCKHRFEFRGTEVMRVHGNLLCVCVFWWCATPSVAQSKAVGFASKFSLQVALSLSVYVN